MSLFDEHVHEVGAEQVCGIQTQLQVRVARPGDQSPTFVLEVGENSLLVGLGSAEQQNTVVVTEEFLCLGFPLRVVAVGFPLVDELLLLHRGLVRDALPSGLRGFGRGLRVLARRDRGGVSRAGGGACLPGIACGGVG